MSGIHIRLRAIPHSEQRYPTAGDWIGDTPGRVEVLVSDTGDWRYNFLVALHELVEATLCNQRGITQAEVDAFDQAFVAEGKEGEPGDDPLAPYRREHHFAHLVECLMAAEMGVDWGEYGDAIDKLFEGPGRCESCGVSPADPPSKLCPGCEAYSEHQR